MKKFFNQKIKIGKTFIGEKFKTFIIAEIESIIKEALMFVSK